jgi:DNA invertase Pin-like site-specific DNA recombinase
MEKPKDFSDFETEADILKEDLDSDLFNRKVFQKTRNLFIVKESETAKIPYKRKKWRKLMQYIDKGKVKGLLSFSPDRQARNLLEGGELINFVDEEKIDLKYTNFHFEDSASGKMMLGVRFVFAKQYSDAISENINR